MNDRFEPDPPAPTGTMACDLAALTPSERERRVSLADRLASSLVALVELPDGYLLRASSGLDLEEVQELVCLERRCCSFLKMESPRLQPDGTIEMRITGGEGVKDFLKSAFALRR